MPLLAPHISPANQAGNNHSPHALPVQYEGYAGWSWLTPLELEWLQTMVPVQGLFMEVGTASGVSAAIVAAAHPDLHILCIDNYLDHDAEWVVQVALDGNRVDNWRKNRQPNMNLFLGTIQEWGTLTSVPQWDCIMIDGSHEQFPVSQDLTTARQLLTPTGYLILHDYCPYWPGVPAAADELLTTGDFIQAEHHGAFMVLRRGSAHESAGRPE